MDVDATVYVDPGCPWCAVAVALLKAGAHDALAARGVRVAVRPRLALALGDPREVLQPGAPRRKETPCMRTPELDAAAREVGVDLRGARRRGELPSGGPAFAALAAAEDAKEDPMPLLCRIFDAVFAAGRDIDDPDVLEEVLQDENVCKASRCAGPGSCSQRVVERAVAARTRGIKEVPHFEFRAGGCCGPVLASFAGAVPELFPEFFDAALDACAASSERRCWHKLPPSVGVRDAAS